MVTVSNYGVKSIFYTTDAGATWTAVSGNLEENPDGTGNGPSITWAHIYNDGSATRYYIGSSTGLYSTDQLNGANTIWAQEGANTIGNVVINMITSRTFDNTIVVATHGNGMYSNKVFTPSGINKVNEVPFTLNVYPNPGFGEYTLDVDAKLVGEKIDIYSFDGKLVSSQLISNVKTELHLKGAAGVYFVKVKGISRKLIKL